MDSLQTIKQRFGIIGNNAQINRAIEKAIQVAPTDISVMVMGENGSGKEFIPKIIHNYSTRKHKQYIAVNCGAIPDGTIDSEFFGHEKGSFTGADKARKGYFEVADGGTIFLDEVGELPLHTQVRLLRVLETGEFIKVGSSEVQKTNVRIVAATNVNLLEAIQKGKFREDLYYRLNTLQIDIIPLRDRREDIHLLFRKFANDFAEKYRMPVIKLSEDAAKYISHYYWPGNVRQLRNFVEQLTVVENKKDLNANDIKEYLPEYEVNSSLIALNQSTSKNDFSNEREILFKILFDLKQDVHDLKSLTYQLIQNKGVDNISTYEQDLINKVYRNFDEKSYNKKTIDYIPNNNNISNYAEPDILNNFEDVELNEETLSIHEKEIELIKKALEKYEGKRKKAADELGISERTLYRKIKQFNLEP